ncbi:MAG: 16S rRNA (guanine(966)-N(2))-methyltransferase RsmD [Helicobacteraceae bacterium]|nr:16S rRNA (guanine(966)-N(2))-methyltransferase RsmD [Helicobacteraceae bacterium]
MKNIKTLRILGGIHKGKPLKMASLEVTRSSKAILKESLFNTLSADILNTTFIEFFAGSGSVGIEALSRGAKFALFFEKNKESFKILEWNLKNTFKDSTPYRAILGDTFIEYKNALKPLKSPTIAYIDPPFDTRENMQDIYKHCFNLIKTLDSKLFKIIIIEHDSKLEIPANLGEFSHYKTRKFGRSSLSYFAPNLK